MTGPWAQRGPGVGQSERGAGGAWRGRGVVQAAAVRGIKSRKGFGLKREKVGPFCFRSKKKKRRKRKKGGKRQDDDIKL